MQSLMHCSTRQFKESTTRQIRERWQMNNAQQPVEWSVKAQNLPEHARNPIHTDAGAQAAGFPRALVAGVTTYAYMTHPLIVAWGEDWLACGGGEVRFRRPVFDHDVLRCVPVVDGDVVEVQAITSEPEQPRAIFRAVRDGGAVAPLREGEVLPSKEFQLIDTFSCDYGSRAGDDLLFLILSIDLLFLCHAN